MPECRQALPVAEYLAETEPELYFFVVGGDALHFRHEDGLVLLPCQVEVRFWRQAGARFDPGVTEYASELVLGVGVSSQAPFDQRRINAERVSASGQVGYPCLAVRRVEARACGTQRRLMRNGEHGIGRGLSL